MDRDNHDLNKKLNQESDELKAAPEIVLWSGIPNSLRPKTQIHQAAGNALSTAENALYSDVIQINTNRHPNSVNPVSPLTIADQTRSANNNQIFQVAWSPPGTQRGNRGTGRRRPYNQGQSRQEPQQQSQQFQSRRRPHRGGPPQYQQNCGNEFLGILKQLVDRF